MKSESATKHKLKQVRFRHLKKRVAAGLKELPGNCLHNHEFMHPHTNGSPTGMCICPAQTGERLCDRAWGGIEKAKTCPHFQARQTKDEIKEEFASELGGMAFAQIAFHFPDLAALLWTLGDDEVGEDVDWEGVPDEAPEESNWVELYGVKLRAGSPETQGILDKLLAEIEEAGTLTALTGTLNVALERALSDNTRLREDNERLGTALAVPDPPKPPAWWRRWFGGAQ